MRQKRLYLQVKLYVLSGHIERNLRLSNKNIGHRGNCAGSFFLSKVAQQKPHKHTHTHTNANVVRHEDILPGSWLSIIILFGRSQKNKQPLSTVWRKHCAILEDIGNPTHT
ncbi:hypothetical protein ACLKA6_007502 [Drosophila palustris]